jgi:hypothetical protein
MNINISLLFVVLLVVSRPSVAQSEFMDMGLNANPEQIKTLHAVMVKVGKLSGKKGGKKVR